MWSNLEARDTAYVLTVTVFAIVATYGLLIIDSNGRKYGVQCSNELNSILLLLSVDYGLHVVMRVREFATVENEDGQRESQRLHHRVRRSVRTGAILTSAALLVAIFTDVIGFLSFRFSSQQFLVSFGTVIAIGLIIYLVSITALPALMLALLTKDYHLLKRPKLKLVTSQSGLDRSHQTNRCIWCCILA